MNPFFLDWRYFNSHPHEEDDWTQGRSVSEPSHFNSHPHEEDDARLQDPFSIFLNISTHILTKRMTWIRWHKLKCFIISTHILTKRMTAHASEFPLYQNISTHILTKRMTAILNKNNLFKIAYYINNKHFISIVDIFFHFHIYF